MVAEMAQTGAPCFATECVLDARGEGPRAGDLHRNPALAATLEAMATQVGLGRTVVVATPSRHRIPCFASRFGRSFSDAATRRDTERRARPASTRAGSPKPSRGAAPPHPVASAVPEGAAWTERLVARVDSAVRTRGGNMSVADLATHQTDYPEPLSVGYRGCDVRGGAWDRAHSMGLAGGLRLEIPLSLRSGLLVNTLWGLDRSGRAPSRPQVWQHPPNGGGLIVLIALGILSAALRGAQAPSAFSTVNLLCMAHLHGRGWRLTTIWCFRPGQRRDGAAAWRLRRPEPHARAGRGGARLYAINLYNSHHI